MALARARQRKRARPEERAKENARRDYRKEYDRDNASAKRLAYRGKLQKIARKRGFYGNTPKGKELGHQADGSIVLEDKKQNRRKGARNASKARVANTLARANARRQYT